MNCPSCLFFPIKSSLCCNWHSSRLLSCFALLFSFPLHPHLRLFTCLLVFIETSQSSPLAEVRMDSLHQELCLLLFSLLTHHTISTIFSLPFTCVLWLICSALVVNAVMNFVLLTHSCGFETEFPRHLWTSRASQCVNAKQERGRRRERNRKPAVIKIITLLTEWTQEGEVSNK